MNSRVQKFIEFFYPKRCAFCNKIIESDRSLCKDCENKVPHKAMFKGIIKGYVCVAPFVYDDVFRYGVLNLKFNNLKHNGDVLGEFLGKCVRENLPEIQFDYVTSVPLHKKALKERNYNQAEMIARKVAEITGAEYVELLCKPKANRAQHTLNRKERAENVKGVFKLCRNEKFTGKNILLVDDVATTGCTFGECCKVLHKTKAEIYGCVLCISKRLV